MEGRGPMLFPSPTVNASSTSSPDIVRRRLLRDTPDSDMEVYGAPLLVLQANHIVEDSFEPLRARVHHRFNSTTDDMIYMDRRKCARIMPAVGIVGGCGAMHRKRPLGRSYSDEEVGER